MSNHSSSSGSVTSSHSQPLELDDFDHQQRHVRLTDRKLVELSARTAQRANWKPLLRRAAPKSSIEDDMTTTRHGSMVTVVGSAIVSCSVAEMRAFIRPSTTVGYAAAMREMFGPDFVYGAVVHHIQRSSSEVSSTRSLLSDGDVAGSDADSNASSVLVNPQPVDLLVKTVTYAQRHFLALNEQWCILDAEHELCDSEGFAVTMTSLHPDDVFTGKTHAPTVSALTAITAIYTVVPESKSSVRITIQVQGDAQELVKGDTGSNGFSLFHQGLTDSAATSRLQELVSATIRLADLVPQRRRKAHILTDPRAFASIIPPSSKTRCACCTKRFSSSSRRKQCHFCGFFVCDKCAIVHDLQHSRIRHYVVCVCLHCAEMVDHYSIENLPSGGSKTSTPTIFPDGPDATPSATLLERSLRDAFTHDYASPTRKATIKSVIRFLSGTSEDEIERKQSQLDAETEGWQLRTLTEESTDSEHLDALSIYSRSRQDPPLSACRLGNSQVGENDGEPVPAALSTPDEEHRLRWLEQFAPSIDTIKDLPELDLLCELASKELGCQIAAITTANREETHVLATTAEAFRGFVYPRDQTFCTRTIMATRLPVLVPHPGEDASGKRQATGNVHGPLGSRFYFGFPLRASIRWSESEGRSRDNIPVIATFCCTDGKPRTVTRAQYATLGRLAECAERVLQRFETGSFSK